MNRITDNNIHVNTDALRLWMSENEDTYNVLKQRIKTSIENSRGNNTHHLKNEEVEMLTKILPTMTSLDSYDGFEINQLIEKSVDLKNDFVCAFLYYIYLDEEADLTVDQDIPSNEISQAVDNLNDACNCIGSLRNNIEKEDEKSVNEELNLLFLRRWHYEHPEEYSQFLQQFEKAYDGDMTFINKGFIYLVEMLSLNGIEDIIDMISCFTPGTDSFQKAQFSSHKTDFHGTLSKILNATQNKGTLRGQITNKNPHLLSTLYWLVFDDGFLHASELLSKVFLDDKCPMWINNIGNQTIQSLVHTSLGKAAYTKSQWKQLNKGNTKDVVSLTLQGAKGRRGRKVDSVLLEEMLLEENVEVITNEIEKQLSEWKEENKSDSILAYIFIALNEANLLNAKYNYRTFHAAVLEKFQNYEIKKGYDCTEALYNAIMKGTEEDSNLSISGTQIDNGKKIVRDIKIKLLSSLSSDVI